MANLVLSYSQLDTLGRCGQMYYQRYRKKAPGIVTAPLIVGRAIHKALEANFRYKLVEGVDLDHNAVAQVYREEFDKEASLPQFTTIEDLTENVVDWGKDDKDTLRDNGQKSLLRYHKKHAPFVFPDLIEERIKKTIMPGVDLVGYLDLVTVDGVVIDFKTVARPWPQGWLDMNLQATVYAWLLGRPIVFDAHFISRTKDRVTISIRRTTRTSSDISWLEKVHVPQAVEFIRQENWVRSPGIQCDRCEYRRPCGYRV